MTLARATVVLLLVVSAPAAALEQEVAASLAAAGGRSGASGAWLGTLEPLPNRVRVGAGARLLGFAGFGRASFSTGDPDLIARGETTSLVVRDARAVSVNVLAQVVVRLAGPLEVGANIDLAGLSAGPKRTGDHRTPASAFEGPRAARVSSLNLLLIGNRDRGQLDSEFFLGWRLPGAFTVRAGLTHVATEYRTVEPLDHGNRRFRRFTTQPFLGVAWQIR